MNNNNVCSVCGRSISSGNVSYLKGSFDNFGGVVVENAYNSLCNECAKKMKKLNSSITEGVFLSEYEKTANKSGYSFI